MAKMEEGQRNDGGMDTREGVKAGGMEEVVRGDGGGDLMYNSIKETEQCSVG